MSLLTVVRDVCAAVGVNLPNSVFANLTLNRTMQEMLALANEMAQRVAYDTREWTQLKKQATFTGDGAMVPPPPAPNGVFTGTTAFNLPPDYLRMLVTANVWKSTSTQQPMRFIADTDEWLYRRARNYVDSYGEWTLLGNQMHIFPIMAGPIAATPGPPPTLAVPAETATFAYIDRNSIILNSGGFGDRFTNDLDGYRLPERLLKLAMIWQWKAQKGSPYAEDMGSFGDALTMLMGSNKPAPILLGNAPISTSAKVTNPWPSGWGAPP